MNETLPTTPAAELLGLRRDVAELTNELAQERRDRDLRLSIIGRIYEAVAAMIAESGDIDDLRALAFSVEEISR